MMSGTGAALDGAVGGDDACGTIDTVVVTAGLLERGRTVLDDLGADVRCHAPARQARLTAAMGDAALAAAIDRRLIALRQWQDGHDLDRSWTRAHLLEAAALAALVDTDHGTGFDDAGFGDLVAFIAELPW